MTVFSPRSRLSRLDLSRCQPLNCRISFYNFLALHERDVFASYVSWQRAIALMQWPQKKAAKFSLYKLNCLVNNLVRPCEYTVSLGPIFASFSCVLSQNQILKIWQIIGLIVKTSFRWNFFVRSLSWIHNLFIFSSGLSKKIPQKQVSQRPRGLEGKSENKAAESDYCQIGATPPAGGYK
jgi:hypothetical protein